MTMSDEPDPDRPLPALTAMEAVSVHLALYHLLGFVPSDHPWSQEERGLWDAADGAMRRVRGLPPADEAKRG
jgi:hypothetical protein